MKQHFRGYSLSAGALTAAALFLYLTRLMLCISWRDFSPLLEHFLARAVYSFPDCRLSFPQ